MLRKLLALAALCCACSGNPDLFSEVSDAGADAAPPEDLELGQVAQALTWPAGYGSRLNDHQRCYTVPAAGCSRAKFKTYRHRFFASTCTSWYQTRVLNAYNKFVAAVTPLGWTILPPTSGGASDIQTRCDTTVTSGSQLGRFNIGIQTCSGSPQLCAFETGAAYLHPNRLESHADWAGATAAEREIAVENVMLHEYLHSAGLGHASGSGIMNTGFYKTPRTIDAADTTMLGTFQP